MDCWAGDLPAPREKKGCVFCMAEVTVYYHIYNKKHGTIYLTQGTSQTVVDSIGQVPAVNSGSPSGAFAKISKILAVAGVALILFTYVPTAFAWSKNVVEANIAGFGLTQTEVQHLSTVPASSTKINYLPPVDLRLPKENKLVIPSIGVDTTLQEATYNNYEEALKKGVWRVSDFGSPPDQSRPTILAAHRFGYLAWTNLFRRENSFYNLPKLEIGDTVEIDYQQRKYVYEVYGEGKGTEITDYSADLILYTCESLTGPERIFKYARLLRV